MMVQPFKNEGNPLMVEEERGACHHHEGKGLDDEEQVVAEVKGEGGCGGEGAHTRRPGPCVQPHRQQQQVQ